MKYMKRFDPLVVGVSSRRLIISAGTPIYLAVTPLIGGVTARDCCNYGIFITLGST